MENNKSVKELNPLVLAYIGDSVFEILVRKSILDSGVINANELHNQSVKKVCCLAQSKGIEKIINNLTEEETKIYKRGRNSHVSHIPKGATSAQYHKATGLETLFGYLYLEKQNKRIDELFKLIDEV